MANCQRRLHLKLGLKKSFSSPLPVLVAHIWKFCHPLLNEECGKLIKGTLVRHPPPDVLHMCSGCLTFSLRCHMVQSTLRLGSLYLSTATLDYLITRTFFRSLTSVYDVVVATSWRPLQGSCCQTFRNIYSEIPIRLWILWSTVESLKEPGLKTHFQGKIASSKVLMCSLWPMEEVARRLI